jgi:hypothetical protein
MAQFKILKRFRIYPAKTEDVSQGWVRLGGCDLPHRSTVRLSTNDVRKSVVYCEVLSIDDNFIRDYNQPSEGRNRISDPQSALVAAEWYRTRLGLQKGAEAEIEVTSANHVFGRVNACLAHPQVVVRVATWLGIWGFVLGVVGIVLGVAPFFCRK